MLQLERRVDVAIVGGGLLGTATAYWAAKEGIDVALFERHEVNRGASGTNAGNIHTQGFDPALNPFGPNRVRDVTALHAVAARVWRDLETELAADLGLRIGGGVMVAETAQEMEILKAKVALEREFGIDADLLGGADLRSVFPQAASDLVGAEYCRDEGFASPLLAGAAFAARAAERGARIHQGVTVETVSVERDGFAVQTSEGPIHARRVVDAAGAHAGAVAEGVGIPFVTGGRPLTMSVTEPWPDVLGLVVQHVSRRLTLKQTPAGTFLIGGGWPGLVGTDGSILADPESVAANLWTAMRVMPSLDGVRLMRSWGGWIPTMSDLTAFVGEFPSVPGFYIVAADITGFTLGPLLGRVVASLLRGLDPEVDVDPFGPDSLRLLNGPTNARGWGRWL